MRKFFILSALFFMLLAVLGLSIIESKKAKAPHSQPAFKPKKVSINNNGIYEKNGKKYLVDPQYLVIGCDPFPTPGEDRLIPSSGEDPNLDCISSIDEPKFVSVNQANKMLQDQDLVIGLSAPTQQKAYPVKIIFKHEVVNDTLAGQPVLITYCPLIGGAVAFTRTVKNTPVEFGVSGRLYNNDLIMYDRATGSLWLQVTGQAIAGKLMGEKLTMIPAEVVPWKTWKALYPQSQVLTPSEEVKGPAAKFESFFATYEQTPEVPFPLQPVDDSFAMKAWFRGIRLNNLTKAYQEELLFQQPVINDKIGTQPLVVFSDKNTGIIRFFSSHLENTTLSFIKVKNGFMDEQTNSLWNWEGKAVSGKYAGKQLKPIIDIRLYWFSWQSIYPDTEVYQIK